MVRVTNAEQALAGEASSSSRKRQRPPSTVEEEEDGENRGRAASENRNEITEVRSGTMFDLDLLECPVCCKALSAPIYQCDNGHIACSSCCTNLRKKCSACNLPIGNYRCRIMERVVEAIIVPCPNAKYGCIQKFSYGKELVHEKQCRFVLCYCSALNCNDKDVSNSLACGYNADAWILPPKCRDQVVTKVRSSRSLSGTMFELDLLECPVCCNALTTPIYQCDNGHIACSCCCIKLRYKCPACTLPIGMYRCKVMERVVEAIIVPCANAKRGCPEKFSYGEELVHEKQCSFALCHCPAPNCKYAGVYKDLYRHYDSNHRNTWNSFGCGYTIDACMRICDKILVLQESRAGPLVAIQCFEEPKGMYVTVNCIAPSVPGVGELSYHLSYSSYNCKDGEKTMSFGLAKMKRIQKVSFETPEEDFMLIPDYFLANRDNLKMKICIRRLGE